jgi:hypothetical protein
MAEYMPRINGQLVYDQHAWSPAYATGYVYSDSTTTGDVALFYTTNTKAALPARRSSITRN